MGFENGATEDEFQNTGNIEQKSGFDGAKEGQVEDPPGDEGWLKDGREDVITDPEMDGIGVDSGDRSHGNDRHRGGFGDDADSQ